MVKGRPIASRGSFSGFKDRISNNEISEEEKSFTSMVSHLPYLKSLNSQIACNIEYSLWS